MRDRQSQQKPLGLEPGRLFAAISKPGRAPEPQCLSAPQTWFGLFNQITIEVWRASQIGDRETGCAPALLERDTNHDHPETIDQLEALAMKRMANAKEIAQAALFLLSDRSTFMTGSPMIVDGGMSVRLT